MPGTLDKDALAALCREWQDRLGLAHWEIDVKLVRGVEIGNNCGQVDISTVKEQAFIRLKSPEDYHGYFPYDMEQTLVHELLHIPMRYIVDPVDDTLEDALTEAFIERMARLLVRLKHEGTERS